MQGPTRQQQINAAIQSARNYNQLRAVIESYRDDLIGTNGAKIDGKELLSDIQYIIDDTIRKGVVDEFSLNAVTRNYGLRDKLRECCLSVKAEQAQQNFPQLIASAKNIDELIKVINDFPHPILGSDGTPIQKSIAIQKIREMSSEPSAVDAIATMPSVPMIFFAGSHITSSYGLRDKFVSLVKEQYQAQKILSQEHEQKQTKGVKFSENVEKREFQFDPGEEVREGIARGIRRKSASEKPRSGKLLGEEVPRAVIPPEIATRHQQFTDMIGLTKAYMANHLDSVNRFGIKRYDDEAINQLQMKVYDIENALHNGELPPESIVNEFLSTLEKCPVDEDFPSEQKLISDVINIIKMAGAEQPQPIPEAVSQPKNDFDAFLDRLESEKNRPMGEKLSKLVTKDALVKMMDYFLVARDPEVQSKMTSHQVRLMQIELDKIASLKPGESYRLDKKITGLPRTMNVLRGDDGEFKLIIETKSKLSNDTKQVLPHIGGTTKTGKPAWRVDGGEVEYFNLVAKVRDHRDVLELQQEVDLSKQMAGPEVQENVLGKQYSNKGQTKISVYSVKADGSLEKVVTPEAAAALSEQQKNTLIMELLKGVQTFHEQGFAHQDLKPGNILVYGDQSQGYHLKLTDFGLTRKEGDPSEEALATSGYHSPEIAYFFSDPSSAQYAYYNNLYAQNTLAHQVFAANPQLYPSDGSARNNMRTPNLANDMWAVGVIAFEIRHGRKPTASDWVLIQQDPMLKGLLHGDRNQRLNINSALQLHQQQVNQHEQLLAKQKEIEFRQKIQSAKTIDALTTAIQGYPADIKNSQGIVMDKQKMIAAMSTILSKPEDVAAIVARGGMVAEQVKAANITGAHGIYDKFLSLVKAQHQQNLLAKAEQANAQKPQQNLPEKNQQEAPNFAAKASPKIQPEVVVNQISVDKAHEIIRDLMSEMNSKQMTWGIRPGDNRMAYLGPLFTNLAGIIRNDNLTPDQKLLSAHAMIDAVAANKAPDAFNARRIADSALEELKGRPEFAQLLEARMQRPLPKTPDSPPDLPPLPKEVQQPEVVPPQKPPRMQKPVSQQPVEPKIESQQKVGLINVSKDDWDKANNYFSKHKKSIKFAKKGNDIQNSFIKINGEIYAVKNGPCAGEGAFGKVKIIQNQKGENYAVKIEGRGLRGNKEAEMQIMKALNYTKGEAAKKYGKEFKGRFAAKKLYTVMALREGEELFKKLYTEVGQNHYPKAISDEEKLLYAIKSAEAVKVLHDKRIIHCDLKPQNLMANQNGSTIVIAAIDFGFSMKIPDNKDMIQLKYGKGTPGYVAPEVYQGKFFLATDIYALGHMFQNDLRLGMDYQFYNKIKNSDPNARQSMTELLDQLYAKLALQPGLSDAVQQMVKEYEDRRAKEKDLLGNLLSKTDVEIKELYQSYSKSHSSNSVGRWMSNLHKDAGKVVFGKEKTRKEQINLLVECITRLNADPSIRGIDKAEKIYAILSKIERDIGTEHNTRKSGMQEMVQVQKQNLETQFPSLKEKTPSEILNTEKAFLQEVRPAEQNSKKGSHP